MGYYRDDILLDKIVAKIKKLREQKGVTLQEFYNDTSIHLARIESERRNVTISQLNLICKYFGLSLSEFLRGM